MLGMYSIPDCIFLTKSSSRTMKITSTLALLLIITLTSCKQQSEQTITNENAVPAAIPQKTYPEGVAAVFKAHGGIDTWNKQHTLIYTIEDTTKGNQTHTVNLKSRKIRHDAKNYVLGFDGDKVWLQQDSIYFNPERARFSHNLMFYFYAMPFVLGDDGITYTEVDPIELDGIQYPGTKISFDAGVGDAPDDNYILYRDPTSNQMAWLAYTVTYGKGEASDRYSYIRYNHWTTVNGVQLPSKLEWYAVNDGILGNKRFERVFSNISLNTKTPEDTLFEKPEKGEFVK